MPGDSVYTTDRKDEIRKLGRGGEIETWFRIWATSRGGTYFHVEVPEKDLDKAPQLLAQRARAIDSI